jgi:hypothetical protein
MGGQVKFVLKRVAIGHDLLQVNTDSFSPLMSLRTFSNTPRSSNRINSRNSSTGMSSSSILLSAPNEVRTRVLSWANKRWQRLCFERARTVEQVSRTQDQRGDRLPI